MKIDVKKMQNASAQDWIDPYLQSGGEIIKQVTSILENSERAYFQVAFDAINASGFPEDLESPSLSTVLTSVESEYNVLDFQPYVAPVVKLLSDAEFGSQAVASLWLLARHRVKLPDLSKELPVFLTGSRKDEEAWGAPVAFWAYAALFHSLHQKSGSKQVLSDALNANPNLLRVLNTEAGSFAARDYDLSDCMPAFVSVIQTQNESEMDATISNLMKVAGRGGDVSQAVQLMLPQLDKLSNYTNAAGLYCLYLIKSKKQEDLDKLLFGDDLPRRILGFNGLGILVQNGFDLVDLVSQKNMKSKLLEYEKKSRRNEKVGRGLLISCIEGDGKLPDDGYIRERVF